MQITIKVFGPLTDIFPQSEWTVKDVTDTDQLVRVLVRQYPAFQQATYNIAVDKQVIQQNTPLVENNIVALLPPYAGG